MYLIDPENGVMSMTAVVGNPIANAAGYAYALKLRRSDAVVVSFFGDGATEEGVFAESLNFAVLKQLPILFVCENNRYAIHTHQCRRQGTMQICDRAKAHGMPAERIEHNDVLYLHDRIKTVTAKIRAGGGPHFFEVMTYRWREHVGPNHDYHLGFRTEAEAQPWIENDQVPRLALMIENHRLTQLQHE